MEKKIYTQNNRRMLVLLLFGCKSFSPWYINSYNFSLLNSPFNRREIGCKGSTYLWYMQIFEEKVFNRICKVIQNKNANHSYWATCIFQTVEKFSKTNNLSATHVLYLRNHSVTARGTILVHLLILHGIICL